MPLSQEALDAMLSGNGGLLPLDAAREIIELRQTVASHAQALMEREGTIAVLNDTASAAMASLEDLQARHTAALERVQRLEQVEPLIANFLEGLAALKPGES